MGSIMNVYLVDSDAVDAAIGSKDDALYAAISKHWPATAADDGEECGCGGVRLDDRSALRAVIDGGPYDQDCGYAYLEACEAICQHFGEDIDEELFHHRFQRTLDDALGEVGMWDEMSIDLLYGFLDRHRLPDPEWANGGALSSEHCAEEVEAWDNSDPAVRAAWDPMVLRDVETRVEWMRAAKEAGKDLMVFWAG